MISISVSLMSIIKKRYSPIASFDILSYAGVHSTGEFKTVSAILDLAGESLNFTSRWVAAIGYSFRTLHAQYSVQDPNKIQRI
ncbi:hypothetical protein D3C86_1772030 [compost metagenome]